MRSRAKQGCGGKHKPPLGSRRGQVKRMLRAAAEERARLEQIAIDEVAKGIRVEERDARRILKEVPTVEGIINIWRQRQMGGVLGPAG